MMATSTAVAVALDAMPALSSERATLPALARRQAAATTA